MRRRIRRLLQRGVPRPASPSALLLTLPLAAPAVFQKISELFPGGPPGGMPMGGAPGGQTW